MCNEFVKLKLKEYTVRPSVMLNSSESYFSILSSADRDEGMGEKGSCPNARFSSFGIVI